ncbi:MAG: hypothetical protein SNH27_14620 [Rikenellaceae bacterium]
MIDRITMQVYGVGETYIDEKMPDLMTEFDDKKLISRGNYKGLRITYYKGGSTLRVEGSLHKFAKGNNYCRYTFSEAVETLQELSTLLGKPMSVFNITSLEVGVNVSMEEDPMRYVETLAYHKGNPFLLMHPRSGSTTICGSKCSMSEYWIKFYDKIADFVKDEKIHVDDREKLPRNILRYEVKFTKSQLQTFGFKNPTAESLCSRKYATFCANLLYSVLDEIIFADHSIDHTKMPHKSSKDLQNKIKDYIFVTSNGHDRYLRFLSENVGEAEYKKEKRRKATLLKKIKPLLMGKYEKEFREKFAEEILHVLDYKRATRRKV